MADERILSAILRFGLDKQSAGATRDGLDSIKRGLSDVEKQAERTRAQFVQLRNAGREMRQVGLELGLVGAAIGGPLVAAAKAFVDANAKTSAVAQQWKRDTDNITASYQRIGGVVAREMLPAMDQAAKLVDKLATFAEQNPGLVKMALGASGTLVGAGAGLVVLGQATQTAANLALLINALQKSPLVASILGGVGTLAAGGALATGAAVAGGVGVGALGAEQITGRPTARQLLAFAAMGYGNFAGDVLNLANTGKFQIGSSQGMQVGNEWFASIAGLTHAVDANTAASLADANAKNAQSGATGIYKQPFITTPRGGRGNDEATIQYNQRLNAFRQAAPLYQAYQSQQTETRDNYMAARIRMLDDFQKTYWDNEATYAKSRARQVRDFEQQEQQAQQSFNTSRARQLRDFAQSEADSEKSYYEDRLKRARDYGIETARAEQDHQDELLKLQSDHADRARDLAAAGDALGFVKEQRDYEKQRAESEKQYQKDTQRRNADYALQLKDGEDAFKEQRDQRLKDFEQQQKDQADDFKREQDLRAQQQAQRLRDQDSDFRESQDKLKEQQRQRLLDLDTNYAQETAHIKQAFIDMLNKIDPVLTGMKTDVITNLSAAESEFAKFLDGLTNLAGGGSGYCPLGYHWDNQKKACVKDNHTNYAAGGYAAYGMHMLGEQGREFVLTNQATSAAERLVGGSLTQDRILAALARSNSLSVNLGGVNAYGNNRNQLLAEVQAMVSGQLVEAFSQFNDALGSN